MMWMAGHELTSSEVRVLDAIRDFLIRYGGDSTNSNYTSPTGDGRWVPLLEIFPRSAQGTADRRTAVRLAELGVLESCEIAYHSGCVKGFVNGMATDEPK